jgi:hypothetical protein
VVKFDRWLNVRGKSMRAYLSLILAAGLATAAQAQTAANTPAPATVPMAGPAPAAAATVAAPAPAASTAPAAGTPAAAPVPAAPAEAAAPPPPTLPTTGDGAVVLSILEKVCVPAVRGGKLEQLAPAAGMRKDRRSGGYVMALGGDRAYTITVMAISAVNANVCQAEVHYAVGQDAPIVSALNVWSFLHQPELILQANYVAVDPDGVKRVRKSWEHLESASSTAVNFTIERKPDDTPLDGRFDTGKLFYQERTF